MPDLNDWLDFFSQFILPKADSTCISPLTHMQFTLGLSGLPLLKTKGKANGMMPDNSPDLLFSYF